MITDYGLLGKIGGYGTGGIYQKGKAADSSGVSFLELASAKAAQNVTEQTSATGMMWQSRMGLPGAHEGFPFHPDMPHSGCLPFSGTVYD